MVGKRGANIWGSGGRTTRALIELYEPRTLYPHHRIYSSLSAPPLFAHPLLPPSPPVLLWSSNPRAPFEGHPFAHSRLLFSLEEYSTANTKTASKTK